jgi:DNA-directed RNA polymerase specialized sigma subunit
VRSDHSSIDLEKLNPLPTYQTRRIGTPLDSHKDVLVQFLYSRFRKRIAAAINELPERERLVMTLYYYETLASLK